MVGEVNCPNAVSFETFKEERIISDIKLNSLSYKNACTELLDSTRLTELAVLVLKGHSFLALDGNYPILNLTVEGGTVDSYGKCWARVNVAFIGGGCEEDIGLTYGNSHIQDSMNLDRLNFRPRVESMLTESIENYVKVEIKNLNINE